MKSYIMSNLTSVQTQLTTNNNHNNPMIIDELTQDNQTTAATQTAVLRQEATSADYGIILLLALVVAYCWVRVGKK